jgi:hypothetical protein
MIGMKTQHNEGDPRVDQALDDLGFNYEIDSDGDYKIGCELKDGRTQLGFIRSETEEFVGMEIREVFSFGLRSSGPFDARTANFLLEFSQTKKIGAWSVIRDAEDNHLAVFSAKIAADLDGKLLHGVIYSVLATADEIEERLSGRDDF